MTFDLQRLAASNGTLAGLAALTGESDLAGQLEAEPTSTLAIPQLPQEQDVSDAFCLGRDDFFKWFLSQLKNQDPTKPVDDKEFIAQLAQFSLIDTLKAVETALSGTQLAQASSLIGQQVQGVGVDGQPVTGTVDRLVQQGGKLYLLVGERAIEPNAVTLVTAGASTTPGA